MSDIDNAFIIGKRLYLRKLVPEDATTRYLNWLNDPTILRYRSPKSHPSSMADLLDFVAFTQKSRDLYLAICMRDSQSHIGGISLTSLNLIHRTAELNIMIGDRSAWGHGHGSEATAILTRHSFYNIGLHKLWSESANPAFNAMVARLGWAHEGVKREMFLLDGQHVDVHCHGILSREFNPHATASYFES